MDLPVREVGDEFADLVYADPQWLREEFDALIAASFSRPPAVPPLAPPGIPPRNSWRPPSGQASEHFPAGRAWAREHAHRQRSPPL